jgi:type I restriction enzyme S subunit
VNQHVAIIRVDTKIADPFYVLDTVNSDHCKQKLLALAQAGATREALTKDTISNFEIVLPPNNILDRYAPVVSQFHDQREVLQQKNINLRRTRDLLLPRLLSGQITLEAAEAPEKAA